MSRKKKKKHLFDPKPIIRIYFQLTKNEKKKKTRNVQEAQAISVIHSPINRTKLVISSECMHIFVLLDSKTLPEKNIIEVRRNNSTVYQIS